MGEELFRLRRRSLMIEEFVRGLALHVGLAGEDEDFYCLLTGGKGGSGSFAMMSSSNT